MIEEDCDGSDDDDSSFEDVNQFLRNNLNDIAMPQLISCSSQLLTYTYNNYITIPVNLFIFYLIDKIYKREIVYSRNIRVVLLFIYLLCNIFL